ncbi:hypothetical protein JCM14244_16760 [Venenivibrio stagnispumantis]|nr:hypothetical protein [Venenivibrio stagnispumantis]MCW4573550.1 hypothetical protein [Venenivibrio stagnispumantis]
MPSDFEFGVDIPYPNFKPKINRENGIRLFEKLVEKQNKSSEEETEL